MKHCQTKLVQDYFFKNQLETFEHQLILKYYKYSECLFPLDNSYTDWVVHFKIRYKGIKTTYPSLLTSYLEIEINFQTLEGEEGFFHL